MSALLYPNRKTSNPDGEFPPGNNRIYENFRKYIRHLDIRFCTKNISFECVQNLAIILILFPLVRKGQVFQEFEQMGWNKCKSDILIV